MNAHTVVTALLGASVGLANPMDAQDRTTRSDSWRSGVLSESWTFDTPLLFDSIRVDRISQSVFPLGVSVPLGSRWTVDLSGAYVTGAARLVDSTGRRVRDVELNGPTDVKLRVAGRIVGDALTLTLGVNAPTGLTKLGSGEVEALRLLAAPVLRLPSPTLGSGFGATAGLVLARQIGEWAVALGGSFESRASYSPVDAAAAGGSATVTDLDPSDAAHLTLGADRLFGQHRLSLLASYDVYGKDQLTFASSAGAGTTGTFQLGPTMTALALLEFGVAGMQELSLAVVNRYRSSFTGIDGSTAAGSSGNSLDARLRARWGAEDRVGLLVGAEARFDTGLEVDASLATAAGTAGGVTLGLRLPLGAISLEPSVRGVFGTVDTGAVSTGARSLTFGLAIARR